MPTSNSKDNAPYSQPAREEKHTQFFRGAWIPADVFRMVETRIISFGHGWLLVVIDSLVNAQGEGCFATNRYLADRMGMKVRQVQNLLRELQELGLVFQRESAKHKRVLECCWSRVSTIPKKTGKPVNGGTEGCNKLHGVGGCNKLHPYIEGVIDISPSTKTFTLSPPPASPSRGIERGGVESKKKINTSVKNTTVPVAKETANGVNAQRLFDALNKKGLVNPRKTKLAEWERQLRLLTESDGHPLSEVTKTLDQYIPLINSPYMPEAYCAKSFREKYLRIRRRINKCLSVNTTPTQEISNEAKSLAKELGELTWPKGSRSQLSQAVQISLDNYRDYLKQVKGAADPTSKKSFLRLAHHLTAHYVQPPKDFVREWFTEHNTEIQRWEGWGGKLQAFRADHPRFFKMGSSWAEEYSHGDDWGKLMDSIGKG